MPTATPARSNFTAVFFRDVRRTEHSLRRTRAPSSQYLDSVRSFSGRSYDPSYGGNSTSRTAYLTARWAAFLRREPRQQLRIDGMAQPMRAVYGAIMRSAYGTGGTPPSVEEVETFLAAYALHRYGCARHELSSNNLVGEDRRFTDALYHLHVYQTCPHCGTLERLTNAGVCQRCEDTTTTCTSCERRVPEESVNDDGECRHCRQAHENARNSTSPSGYHSTPRRAQRNNIAAHVIRYGEGESQQTTEPIYLGIELETEFRGEEELAETLPELRDLGVICEQDGSLDEYGCEIVTHYGPAHYSLDRMRDVCQTIGRAARSHATTTCGLHINISKAGADTASLARLCVFWNSAHNRGFLQSFCRRWSRSGYSKHKPEKGTYAEPLDRLALNEDRYELVNFQPSNRLEVRAFRGTLKYDTLRACAVLSHALVIYCRYVTEDPARLTWEDFLRWLPAYRVETRYTHDTDEDAARHTVDGACVIEYAKSKGFTPDSPPATAEGVNEIEATGSARYEA